MPENKDLKGHNKEGQCNCSNQGLSWDDIMLYREDIIRISRKYSKDPTLAEDVAQEVMIRMHTNPKLTRDFFQDFEAAIKTVIRNISQKVIVSKSHGRAKDVSLDGLLDESSIQLDSGGNLRTGEKHGTGSVVDFTAKKDSPVTKSEED